ncbi:MAG: MFS transporter [Chloroflexi bacterium]|nr:MAG: MFS transporter [Chloroflexota bacterium]
MSGLAVDLSPLRTSREFRLLWCGQLVSTTGRQITAVAVPYQVYRLTGSTLDVGLLGLVQVVPLVLFSLVGGAIADAVDRRRLMLVTTSLLAVCSLLYVAGAVEGHPPLAVLYAVSAVAAGLGAVDQPARSATVPNLVPRAQLPAAVALMFGLFQVTLIGGPAVGGLIIGRLGLAAAYLVDVGSFGAALAAVALIRPQPPGPEEREPPLRAIRSGLAFARRQPVILAGFAIDLDAMIFGMPRALFPALAAGAFHTGPSGLGLLYAAPGVGGAVAAILGTGWVGRVRHLGRAVIGAVVLWGLAIAAFGLTGSLALGVALLALAGGADSVSAVCRSTMLQTLTPDHLRGRMSATYAMVVMGGPYAGDVEAGAVAAAWGTRVSVVSGGLLCVLGAGLVAAALPALFRYRADPGVAPDAPAAALEGR